MQIKGVNYEETFAPVFGIEAIRIIIAKAASENKKINQIDIATAYQNGIMEHDLYVKFPKGYKSEIASGCLLLVKSLCGTKQGGHQWYKLWKATLIELGFQTLSSEESIYIKGSITIAVYVDDLLVITDTDEAFDKFAKELGARFKIGKSGPAEHLLGIKITKTKQGISIDQAAYIESILTEFWDQKSTLL